jgi:hypothetical protein
MVRLLGAAERYREQVSPKLAETYAIIGRIRPAPEMRVDRGTTITGLPLDVLAATVGDAMFVDLSVVDKNGESAFAGLETLSVLSAPSVSDTASPRQVMEAALAALKIGDQDAWSRLFAEWRLDRWDAKKVLLDRTYYVHVQPPSDWVRARRMVLGDVYDINVVDVGLVHQLTFGDELPGGTIIEQVDVEVEHIGKFDEGYRPFNDASVTRVWILQRLDRGPWRIVTRGAI